MLLPLLQNSLLENTGSNLSLSLDNGSLTLTGQTITFNIGVAVAAGAVTVAGQSVSFDRGLALTAGALGVAGQSVSFDTGVALNAGAVTVAGQDITLFAAGDIAMSLDAGSLTLTGGALDFALTGQTKGAGRSRRRRRYVVEIDGQLFDVDSAEEATALLQQAATLAAKAAETAAQAVVKARLPQARSLGKVKPVTLSARIKTNAPETPQLAQAKSAIQRIYDEAAQRAELQLLLERQAADDDERDIEDLIAIGAL